MDWPKNFQPQTHGYLVGYSDLVKKGATAVHEYFRTHKEQANAILRESYDKRYSPSTFIEEHEDGYRVGWYDHGRQCTQSFQRFEEAVADYVLFSYGIGRFEKQE
jgi:hypothetical protein